LHVQKHVLAAKFGGKKCCCLWPNSFPEHKFQDRKHISHKGQQSLQLMANSFRPSLRFSTQELNMFDTQKVVEQEKKIGHISTQIEFQARFELF